MQKKLFLSYLIIIAAAIGITSAAFWFRGYSYIDNLTKTSNLTQAKMLADLLEEKESRLDYSEFASWYSRSYGLRITIIAKDGTVLADSGKSEELENHSKREEVVKALRGESISVDRYSKTMEQNYSYSAVPVRLLDGNGVLRTSLPLSDIKALDEGLSQSLFYSLMVCLLVAVILAVVFLRIIAAPIKEVALAAEKISDGDYGIKIYTREKSELGRLAASFNIMATNLKSSMQKLTRRNIELEAMLRSMENGAVAIDESNAILFHNTSFSRMMGQEEKDYKGKSLYNVLRNAVTFEAIDAVRESGESEVREGYLIGGEPDAAKMLRVTAAPLIGDNKKKLGVLLLLEDVTQMKKLETIRSDFVSNVTHELKTPLTSIRGFIDTLKEGAIEDTATAKRFLDIIDIEAERLYTLIQDILILSEIEQKKDYEVVACNVDPCVRSVVELLESSLSGNIRLAYESPAYLRPYYCNPDRMKQLIINLLDNAVKYTEEGTVTIRTEELDNKLVITVADTGLGIEQEHLPRIFERFYRVDKSRSRKKGGTGLGLSIVKHIVELYGGNILVESELGKGTTFEIRLPY